MRKSYIQQIQTSGEVAPPGCCVLRYQARGKKAAYWYYKLHATQPIFPTQQPNKLSKYKHLGKAGSPAHIHAVISVARRTQMASPCQNGKIVRAWLKPLSPKHFSDTYFP